MGLTNTPSILKHIISNLFAFMQWFLEVYIDDLIIYSASTEECLQYLSLKFERLKKYTLYVKLYKSKFLQTRACLLGHVANK